MKYTYKLPIFEDSGDKFAKMSDYDFKRWQKGNPASAEKGAKIRKQAQARAGKAGAKPASSTSTSSSSSGKKPEVGTSAITKRGAIVKSNSQGDKSNKVGGSGGRKRLSAAGGKAVDMGVKKVKVRDVTPGQKKMSGSGGSSSSGGKKSGGNSGGSGGNKRPPSGAGKERVAQGGALAKREPEKKTGGVKNYGAKKKLVKAKRVAGKVGKGLQVAGKVAKEVGKVAKAAVSGTNDAFGKSKWEHVELKTYQEFMIECRHARK